MKINVAQYVFPLGCALINDSGSFCAIQLQQAEMHRNKVAKKTQRTHVHHPTARFTDSTIKLNHAGHNLNNKDNICAVIMI